jgi:hypothetical protein
MDTGVDLQRSFDRVERTVKQTIKVAATDQILLRMAKRNATANEEPRIARLRLRSS